MEKVNILIGKMHFDKCNLLNISILPDNVIGALREISEKIGFEYDPKWNTRTFGSKLIDEINKDK